MDAGREQEILRRMFAHLEESLERRPAGPLGAGSHMVRDLHLDSMDNVQLIAELEDHYGVTLPLQLFHRAETLGDVARIVAGAVGEGRA